MLRDIDSDTVDFVPNYDESRGSRTVLPSRFPNLLVNGSAGIAVGMATNMPPHRLGEAIDAVVALIDEPEANVEDLMQHVKGPDFPTGAIVVGRGGIRDAYRTGRGRIVVRARAHIEEQRGGKTAIIVTELPYGVKKGGDDRRDHEDRRARQGEGAHGDLAPSRTTPTSPGCGSRSSSSARRSRRSSSTSSTSTRSLQTTFGYNAVALVDGVPRTLSLLELVTHYLDYQREIVVRRSKYELARRRSARTSSRAT